MLNQHSINFKKIWEKVDQEPTIWDSIEIKNHSFYYETNHKKILLSNFENKFLPSRLYSLTFLGKVLTNLSPLANIMSRRPGTEDITFYVLLNSPQSGLLGTKIDTKVLKIVGPPLVWRHQKIRESINKKIKKYIEKNQSFFFLDIGSGAGFNSLEIERIIRRTNELSKGYFTNFYRSLNIDIDKKWLNNNEILAKELFGTDHRITRKNISIFDFWEKHQKTKKYQYDNLIISCNGFSEFLSDIELRKLYEAIFKFAQNFEGSVNIILPFANKNEDQELLGAKIGFRFKSKTKQDILSIVKKIFINYKVTYCEKYSQIIITVEKNY